jgi:hypothetical protein
VVLLLVGLAMVVAATSKPPPQAVDDSTGLAMIFTGPPLLLGAFLLAALGSLIYALCGAGVRSLIAAAIAAGAILCCALRWSCGSGLERPDEGGTVRPTLLYFVAVPGRSGDLQGASYRV